jgi:DnaJ-class molecular chaperone
MRTVERTRTQTYKVYVAKDGKEFDSEEECKHHEMILDGTRIVCPDCKGQGGFTGKWVEPYEHWEGTMGGYYERTVCPKCNGKGYLEKKITWE